MKHRLLIQLICCTLPLSLVGCGDDDAPTPATQPDTKQTNTDDATEASTQTESQISASEHAEIDAAIATGKATTADPAPQPEAQSQARSPVQSPPESEPAPATPVADGNTQPKMQFDPNTPPELRSVPELGPEFTPEPASTRDAGGDNDEPSVPKKPRTPTAKDVQQATLVAYNEQAYQAADGRNVVDLIQGNLGFVELGLYYADGDGIVGEQFEISSRLGNPIVGKSRRTDKTGGTKIVIKPRKAGLDVITAKWRNRQVQIRFNILTKEAQKWQGFDHQAGFLRWETLLKTNVMYDPDGNNSVMFAPEVETLNQQQVTMTGFMMPLETTDVHKKYLLVSSPPSCFFHTPGGAAGSVEVNMGKPLKMTWEPIILKGQFELITDPDEGLVYRLKDAKLVDRKSLKAKP